jgi:nucleoid-associated protein YgaU
MPVRLGSGGSPDVPEVSVVPAIPARVPAVAALALAGVSLLTTAAVGSAFLNTARDAWTAIAAAGPASPADGILLMAGLGGTLLSLWLGLGMTLSALSALPGALGRASRQLAARVAPAVMRKVVAFVLGTTLTAALIPGTAAAGLRHDARPGIVAAGLAVAAPDASFRFISDPPHVVSTVDAAPPPAWSPTRPEHHGQAVVVVLRGDTLWSIAARHLGPAARAAEINAEWPRWLAANRGVIGDDADLILPGQLLRPPARTGEKS